ncbi:MAG: DJ-1/PfpI/YhbO family deglycase/protease [Phycisphaera sp.]|nr:DJ-1/PfpI/YhbO family deglycase/protease [Phycisphaera sp.]
MPHVLIFAGDDYEDLELQVPRYRLLEAGCGVTLAGPEANTLYHGKHGYPVKSDAAIRDMEEADFDALVIPGGWMPDKLRRDPKVLDLTAKFNASKKPIASICHGPWIDISAKIVKGVTYTSTPAIKDDLTNAGALWVDKPLVIDGHHITSRRPDDLPQFCAALVKMLGLK